MATVNDPSGREGETSKVMERQRQVYSYLLSFRQEQVQSGIFIGCIWFVLFEKEWEGICRIALRWNVCI
jgi:hypothetical protein